MVAQTLSLVLVLALGATAKNVATPNWQPLYSKTMPKLTAASASACKGMKLDTTAAQDCMKKFGSSTADQNKGIQKCLNDGKFACSGSVQCKEYYSCSQKAVCAAAKKVSKQCQDFVEYQARENTKDCLTNCASAMPIWLIIVIVVLIVLGIIGAICAKCRADNAKREAGGK